MIHGPKPSKNYYHLIMHTRYFVLFLRVRWVCDRHKVQSVKFWLKHVGLMRSPAKFGTCEIFTPREKFENV